MTLVAVIGVRATTTAIGLVSVSPDPATLVELDPAGGSAAAWLGVPRQPGLAELVATGDPGRWSAVDHRIQESPTGLRVLVTPIRPVEAAAAVGAVGPLLPVLSASERLFVADVGRIGATVPAAVSQAGAVVLAHRQHPGSAQAAALGIERLADQCATLMMRALPVVVALCGTWPYGTDEVGRFLGVPGVVEVPEDPWAAAVIAGRPGSERRLRRSKLWASMTRLADRVAATLAHGWNDA